MNTIKLACTCALLAILGLNQLPSAAKVALPTESGGGSDPSVAPKVDFSTPATSTDTTSNALKTPSQPSATAAGTTAQKVVPKQSGLKDMTSGAQKTYSGASKIIKGSTGAGAIESLATGPVQLGVGISQQLGAKAPPDGTMDMITVGGLPGAVCASMLGVAAGDKNPAERLVPGAKCGNGIVSTVTNPFKAVEMIRNPEEREKLAKNCYKALHGVDKPGASAIDENGVGHFSDDNDYHPWTNGATGNDDEDDFSELDAAAAKLGQQQADAVKQFEAGKSHVDYELNASTNASMAGVNEMNRMSNQAFGKAASTLATGVVTGTTLMMNQIAVQQQMKANARQQAAQAEAAQQGTSSSQGSGQLSGRTRKVNYNGIMLDVPVEIELGQDGVGRYVGP